MAQPNERFIINSMSRFIWRYLALWAGCVLLDLFAYYVGNISSWVDSDVVLNVCRAFMTLSTITISLAIPTCLATVFDSYSQYRSTVIRSILVERFPITLLIISAFTSLVLVVCGYTSIATDVFGLSLSTVFVLVAYWGCICIIYLFMAIERMLHFTVKSPHAVLDHLEPRILALLESDLGSAENYEDFKRSLSAMGNIATDVVRNTGGNDDVVLRYLRFLRAVYARVPDDERRTWMVRSYTLGELVRIFREAVMAQDEKVGMNTVEITSAMLCDVVYAKASESEIDRVCEVFSRFIGEALSGFSEEMQRLAVSGYWWMAAADISRTRDTTAIETATVRDIPDCRGLSTATYALSHLKRILSGALRRVSDGTHDELLIDFFREASGTAVHHIGVNDIGDEPRMMLDRTVLTYLDWLIEQRPDDALRYARSLSIYSTSSANTKRSVLPDTRGRVDALILHDSLSWGSDDTKVAMIDTQTARMMLLPVNADESMTLAYAVLFEHSDYPHENRGEVAGKLVERAQDALLNGDPAKRAVALAAMGGSCKTFEVPIRRTVK